MSAPLEVFCCYAREDQEMLAHLKKHLAPLECQGQITIWSDMNLNAGSELPIKRAPVEADESTLTPEQQPSGQHPLADSGSQPTVASPLLTFAARTEAIEILHTLNDHTDAVCSAALSADGLILASGSQDHTIKLWNTQKGQLLRTLTGHTANVISVALSADFDFEEAVLIVFST